MTVDYKYITGIRTFLITFKLLNPALKKKHKKQLETTFSLCFKSATIKKSLAQCQDKMQTNNYQQNIPYYIYFSFSLAKFLSRKT
jgi:hypothetical protein